MIYTARIFKGIRVISNLKWGRVDKEETQSGSHYNKGAHSRYRKVDLAELKQAFEAAKKSTEDPTVYQIH